MKQFFRITLVLAIASLGLFSAQSQAQTGTLKGQSMVLSNGTNAVTFKLPTTNVHSWTLTLPNDTANGLQFLYDDGTGHMHWGVPASLTSTGTVLYNVSGPQTLTALSTDLFNIGYNTSDPGPALGALIDVTGSGPSSSVYGGLCDTARNVQTSTVHVGMVSGLVDTVGNAGSGTQTGLQVTVSGSGTNYALIATGGDVGIGTGGPTEKLEVSGNVRISGQNGLKVSEGTNAKMGTVVMNGVNAVVVNNSSVTANSRIYLTPQNTGACNCIGMPYVSTRVGGTSFSVKSTQAGDNSTVAYIIIEP